jgi:hypothetical protein
MPKDEDTPARAVERLLMSVQPKGKTRETATTPEERNAALFREALAKRWRKSKKRLSQASDVSEATIYLLRKTIPTEATTSLRKVCDVIGVDADALVRGRLEYLNDGKIDHASLTLIEKVRQIEGTIYEPALEALADELLILKGRHG